MRYTHRVNCTVCSRPDRSEIDKSLAAGTSARAVSAAFHIGRNPMRIYSQHTPKTIAPLAIAPDDYIRFRVPADVVLEIERRYNQSLAHGEKARAASDSRQASKEDLQGAQLLEKLAKSFALYSDGSNVTVNLGQSFEQ